MKLFRSIALLLSVSVLLSACTFSLAADVTPPPGYQAPVAVKSTQAPVNGPLYPLVPPSPKDGEAIFAEKCAPCHGATGLGDGPRAAQLPNPVTALGSAEVARAASPAEWYSVVTQGNLDRFMPPFASLSDRQRWDVVAYAYSLTSSPASLAQGAQLYQENCAGCHGDAGKGDGLAVKPKDLTNQELMSAKTGADLFQAITTGVGNVMPAFGDKLSEADRWALVDTLRARTFASPGQVAAADATPVPGAAETPAAPAAPVTATGSLTGTASITSTMGVISGTITNASGGEVPAGLQVLLHGFDQMQNVFTQTTTTGADGRYVFQSVEMPAGRVFLTTVDYQNTSYGSDIATAESGKTGLSLPISIYETTTDTSGLSIDRLHLFFEVTDAKTMRVIELYIISNPGAKTLVASEKGKPVLTFKLPEGAANLQFQDGELGGRYLATEGGFGDTVPVRPGQGAYQVLFAFDMPYDKKLELAQPMSLPANAVVVLVPETNVKVKGDALEDAGTRDVQGAQYRMYNSAAMAAGDVLRLTVTGSPSSAPAGLASSSREGLLVGAGALGLVLILAGVWLYRRSRIDAVEELDNDMPVVPASAGESTETIMDAILALDDLYKAGELPEAAYLQRRDELKARLKELLQ